MPSKTVPIDAVIADSRCQSRTGIDLALVQEYADAIEEGAALPPLSTIRATEGYYLYDGFHRIEAYRQASKREVPIEYRDGDVWDAVEQSCRVNATHGKRRTNADKHRAVETMLKVMQHKAENWSDSEIARRCAVSQPFVSGIRANDPSHNGYKMAAPISTQRNGTTYEMNTAGIGKRVAAVLDPGPDIDIDTDEIEAEYVDPSDPSTFAWSPPPAPKPTPPTPPQRDFDPEPIAAEIVKRHGRGRALEIADAIYEIAE